MSKIAIISQAEQGVLIDISGCSSLQEAKQYLTSTLQVSSQFWDGLTVDLNLGPLVFTPEQVNEIQAIVSDVGVHPRQIYSLSPITRSSLKQCLFPPPPAGAGADEYAAAVDRSADQATLLSHLEAVAKVESTLPDSFCASVALPDGKAECEEGMTPGMETDKEYPEAIKFYAGNDTEYTPSKKHSLPELWLAARSAESGAGVVPSKNQYPDLVDAPDTFAAPVAVKAKPAAPAAVPARNPGSPGVLLMKQTLRSGQSVNHSGHLIIIGDVNPGAELVADGDITVWGALRGMAHAGANGNTNAEIRALKFEPIQLRIAQAIARSPDRNKASSIASAGPETARIVEGKIRITGSEPD